MVVKSSDSGTSQIDSNPHTVEMIGDHDQPGSPPPLYRLISYVTYLRQFSGGHSLSVKFYSISFSLVKDQLLSQLYPAPRWRLLMISSALPCALCSMGNFWEIGEKANKNFFVSISPMGNSQHISQELLPFQVELAPFIPSSHLFTRFASFPFDYIFFFYILLPPPWGTLWLLWISIIYLQVSVILWVCVFCGVLWGFLLSRIEMFGKRYIW